MPSLTVRIREVAKPEVNPRGYAHLEGPFVREHRHTIEALLRNEARRARVASPCAEILALDDEGAGLLVSTSTEHLAHRLGRRLHKAFGGELHHGFHHQHKLAFVRWWR